MTKPILETLLYGSIVLGCVAIVAIAHHRDHTAWQRFAVEHECKVIARAKGQTVTTYASDSTGKIITGTGTTKSTATWRCNDGVDYTRPE